MLNDFISKHFISQVNANGNTGYVAYGYGQVEPNHLSAQRTGQIYAQLPANKNILMLENGQFAKYDYANGEVNFSTEDTGEWLLVFNEIKLYREGQMDCEFAMRKDDYQARVYSPYDWDRSEPDIQSRFYNGIDSQGNPSITIKGVTYQYDDVTAGNDPYEIHYNEDPFHNIGRYKERMMKEGTHMVPRLFKTNQGDIMTTNMIAEAPGSLQVGNILKVRATDGILCKAGTSKMAWQVVRVYTMPDGQPGVKIMRVQ